MTRNTTHNGTATGLSSSWRRARRATAGQVMPLARTAGAAAKHQADKTRAWAAPQVERAGQVLQDNITPKASALLSAAAHRIDPAPRRRPWRKVAGASAAAALASGVAVFAAAVRRRMKADVAATMGPTEEAASRDPAPKAETLDGENGPDSGDPRVDCSADRAS